MHPTPLPWYIVLLLSIPQTFLIIKIGFRLFNLPVSCSKALLLSLAVGVVSIFARGLPLPFGVHTIILAVSSTLLATVVTGTNLWHCFISILTGSLILGVLEGVLVPVLLKITAATTDSLASEPWLNVLYFLPSGTIMAVVYLLAKKRNYALFDLRLNKD
ncbi:hypothetical protein [Pelotomaculum schinkii]|nr:hypothetical protein [Pelotomaculum schinkii]